MNAIQKWFERLAGISQDELDRIALAAKVFAGSSENDLNDLTMPACWRRRCKIRA